MYTHNSYCLLFRAFTSSHSFSTSSLSNRLALSFSEKVVCLIRLLTLSHSFIVLLITAYSRYQFSATSCMRFTYRWVQKLDSSYSRLKKYYSISIKKYEHYDVPGCGCVNSSRFNLLFMAFISSRRACYGASISSRLLQRFNIMLRFLNLWSHVGSGTLSTMIVDEKHLKMRWNTKNHQFIVFHIFILNSHKTQLSKHK